jgi:hypothetical protein
MLYLFPFITENTFFEIMENDYTLLSNKLQIFLIRIRIRSTVEGRISVVEGYRAGNSTWIKTRVDQPISHLDGGVDDAIRFGCLSGYLWSASPGNSPTQPILA